MRYMGGKFTLATHLLPFILESKPTRIIEPFLGGGNFMVRAFKEGFAGEYIAGDYDKDNSYMWRCVLEGWLPKYEDKPTRDEYNEMKVAGFSANPLRGFARSIVAFGARPWWGYALETNRDRNSSFDDWASGCRAMKRDAAHIVGKDIKIIGGDYSEYDKHITASSVIYCDPPYENATGYSKDKSFDHVVFWDTVREWSLLCPVYVSELSAPDDFMAVFEKVKSHNMSGRVAIKNANEKLFVHRSRINKGA